MAILPDRSALDTPADGDLYMTTDVSDTTDAATGTDKKITWANIKTALQTHFSTLYAGALGADDNYVTDAEKVKLTNLSGTNTGDQTSIVGITGTKAQFDTACSDGNFLYVGDVTGISDGDKGDITVSASGATWTIDNGAVTLAKQADMATSSVVYRKTAGSGAPEVQTLATLKTDLGLTGTNTGDQTSIVGITGTMAQFDTAVSDGNIVYQSQALGTPSSGTLTNCTGLPLAGVVDSTTEALGVGTLEVGHASDTTISRTGAGAIAVEGVGVALNSTSLTHTASTIELGHASDTTLSRVSAGVVAVEGVNLVKAGAATSSGLTMATARVLGRTTAATGAIEELSTVDSFVTAASDTAAGKVELATIAETNTGTDAARAITPDGLAGSNFGIRYVQVTLNGTTALTTSEKAYFRIPAALSGMNLVSVTGSVGTGAAGSSSSGTPTFTVKNVTDGNQMLSTSLTIDVNEYTSATAATPVSINTSFDDVVTDDLIEVAVTTAGTGVTYAVITLGFALP